MSCRLKRRKHVRKVLRYLSACFGFREPYRVLCDGTFIHHLLVHHLLPADDALSKFLRAHITLFSSRCITAELEVLGESHAESAEASKQLTSARCVHERRVSAPLCIESIVSNGNRGHFFVATQDKELRKKLRELPGVPVIYGVQNCLFLDEPSEAQRQFFDELEDKQSHVPEWEREFFKKEAEKYELSDQTSERRAAKRKVDWAERSKSKRKRAKGPNPLSCKKKKSKESQHNKGDAKSAEKKKRKNKRKKNKKEEKNPDTAT